MSSCCPQLSSCPQFHDRAVVASLKQKMLSSVHSPFPKFHDRAVVASLKRLQFVECMLLAPQIPRPRGRGLIEALCPLHDRRSAFLIPRPRGRGLIEAEKTSLPLSIKASQFHDRAVVASLKREFPGAGGVRTVAIPRPRGRGLIEALGGEGSAIAAQENSTTARSWPH